MFCGCGRFRFVVRVSLVIYGYLWLTMVVMGYLITEVFQCPASAIEEAALN